MPRQEVNIYCDESRYSNPDDPYLVIGAVKCLRDKKPEIASALAGLKLQYGIGGEFDWKSASSNKAGFYNAAIDWFVARNDVMFRCVVANKSNLWLGDREDAFYAVYHQLLYHWLVPGNSYYVYLDRKNNVKQGRVDTLRKKTGLGMPKDCSIACMEEVESRECLPSQLADLIIGCIGYEWNGHTDPERFPGASSFKKHLCEHLACKLGRSSLRFSTWASEPKFNVFLFGE